MSASRRSARHSSHRHHRGGRRISPDRGPRGEQRFAAQFRPASECKLKPDERGPGLIRPAALFVEPVGVHQARCVLVGAEDDRAEECRSVTGHGFRSSVRESGLQTAGTTRVPE